MVKTLTELLINFTIGLAIIGLVAGTVFVCIWLVETFPWICLVIGIILFCSFIGHIVRE